MGRPFRFDRSWRFEVGREALWLVLARTDEFPRWWTWLRRFEVGSGLVDGAVARCVVRPPLPYVLRFDVAVERVVPAALVETTVSGDIEGPARLELSGDGDRAEARLVWEVDVRDPLLRTAARVARPLMEWGHEWVVDTGVEQFRRRALDGA